MSRTLEEILAYSRETGMDWALTADEAGLLRREVERQAAEIAKLESILSRVRPRARPRCEREGADAMTKAIDETWEAEGNRIVGPNNGVALALFDALRDSRDTDAERARLASVAPEALRLLLAREWGRHNQCLECGGVSFVPAERSLYQGHKSSCAWVGLMRKAGLR